METREEGKRSKGRKQHSGSRLKKNKAGDPVSQTNVYNSRKALYDHFLQMQINFPW